MLFTRLLGIFTVAIARISWLAGQVRSRHLEEGAYAEGRGVERLWWPIEMLMKGLRSTVRPSQRALRPFSSS